MTETLSKKNIVFICLLFLGLSCLIYSPSLNGDFLWDDTLLIEGNPYLRDASFLPRIVASDWGEGINTRYGYYRPLAIFSYFINYSIHKLNVFGYHLTNLFLHGLVAITLFIFSLHIFKKITPSFITGLLFLSAPIHSTLACYISGRADLFATFFILLSLIQYIKYLDQKKRLNFCLFFFSFILALLSKEIALILPLLCLLYSWVIKKTPDIRSFIINSIVIIFYFIIRQTAIKGHSLDLSYIMETLPQRIPGIFVALYEYIRLFFVPVNLRMDYGNVCFPFSDIRCITGIIIFCLLLFFAFKRLRHKPIISFGIFWFFICLLPVSNIYPVAFFMAEHFLYLPSIGIFILASFLLCKIENKKFLYFFVFFLTFFYAITAFKQSFFWKDSISLYSRSLSFSQNNWVLHNNIGLEYSKQKDFGRAIFHLEKAISLCTKFNTPSLLLTDVYIQQKKEDLAIEELESYLEKAPNDITTYNKLAMIYINKKKYDTALGILNKAIEVDPEDPQTYNSISLIYHLQQKPDKEFVYLQKAFDIDKNNIKTLTNIGTYYASAGAADQATIFYQRALDLFPANKDALNNLATTLFFDEKYQEALKLYNLALKIDPSNEEIQKNINICLSNINHNK